MILSVKIRTISLILAVLVLIGGAIGIWAATRTSVVPNGKTVVLDAGHGGRDGGVAGVNTKTKESDINLAIVKALEGFLTANGYKVILTRKNSDGLYSVFSKNKKLSDMQKRKEIINNAKPDLVVSVHQNAYPSSSVRGAQVFYSPNSETGREIATGFQNILNPNLNSTKVAMKGDYYILECSEYPSVLVECGFLSNPEEERLLISAEYQQKVAYTIFTAIHSLLFTNDLPYLI